MKTDELLYPPGTLVARWYAFRHDWPYATADKAGDVRVAILRVNNNGYYEQIADFAVAPFDLGNEDRAAVQAMHWIKQQGCIYEPAAAAGDRVPRKGEIIRQKLRKVAQ